MRAALAVLLLCSHAGCGRVAYDSAGAVGSLDGGAPEASTPSDARATDAGSTLEDGGRNDGRVGRDAAAPSDATVAGDAGGPPECTTSSECADSEICNGTETCDDETGRCTPGARLANGSPCLGGSCMAGVCVTTDGGAPSSGCMSTDGCTGREMCCPSCPGRPGICWGGPVCPVVKCVVDAGTA